MEKTRNVALVGKALGHKSLKTTQRYIDPLEKELEEAMK